MNNMVSNFFKKPWFVLSESFSSFRKNNDLTAASSLAFYAMLALIPALYLLTFLLGAVIGSSAQAFRKTQELMSQFVPAYSQVILKEVGFITSHKGAIGLVNLVVLFWSITPLVSELRLSLGVVFPKGPSRPFLLEKLFDVAISIIFLIGLSAVAVAGVALNLMERIQPLRLLPIYLEEITPFIVVTGVVFSLYFTFSSKMRIRQLVVGSLVTSLLWFAMRPAFHLFLTYNPGYGFAFGSFKSLFVVIIWIYYFLVVFLFGAEVAAASAGTRPSSQRN
jgi:membrane protein